MIQGTPLLAAQGLNTTKGSQDSIQDTAKGWAVNMPTGSKKPMLGRGIVIDKPSFIVDNDGVCWWIDPTLRVVKEVQ